MVGGIPLSEPSSPISGPRRRVRKACDRCRLKKSKCDGATICGRCKADNAICLFSDRKKSHDKVYSNSYVEMLESQHSQLVAGLRELCKRLQEGEDWNGFALEDDGQGKPLTHAILERIGMLNNDGSKSFEAFEEKSRDISEDFVAENTGPARAISNPASQQQVSDFAEPMGCDVACDSPMSFNLAYDAYMSDPTMWNFGLDMCLDHTGLDLNPYLTMDDLPGSGDQKTLC